MSKPLKIGNLEITNKTAVELKATVTELDLLWNDTLVPTLAVYSTLYSKVNYTNEKLNDINQYLLKNLNAHDTNWSGYVSKVVSQFKINDFLKTFTKRFENGIDVDTLTAQDAAYLDAYNKIYTFANYTVNFTLYSLIIEQGDTVDNDLLTESRTRYIEDNYSSYLELIQYIAKKESIIVGELNQVGDDYIATLPKDRNGAVDIDQVIKVTAAIGTALAALYLAGKMAIRLPTLYKWRLSGGSALIIAQNIQRNKDLKKALELRLVNLKNIQANNPDAGLERTIKATESRIAVLEAKLIKAEKKYA